MARITTFTDWIETKSSGIELWLDDERDPDDPFIQEEFHARPGMTWVKSAGRAIQVLGGGDVTYMSFDHDLGPGAGTGYEVARWRNGLKNRRIMEIYLNSCGLYIPLMP